MSDSAPLPINIRDYAGKKRRCRRAEVCPEDYRKGSIYSDQAVLGQDREGCNGNSGRLYYSGTRIKTYQETKEGIQWDLGKKIQKTDWPSKARLPER